jgi:hypothetical protein
MNSNHDIAAVSRAARGVGFLKEARQLGAMSLGLISGASSRSAALENGRDLTSLFSATENNPNRKSSPQSWKVNSLKNEEDRQF